QHGVAVAPRPAALDHQHRVGTIRVDAEAPAQRLPRRALHRSEPEMPAPVVPQHEPGIGGAQQADAVEQDDGIHSSTASPGPYIARNTSPPANPAPTRKPEPPPAPSPS